MRRAAALLAALAPAGPAAARGTASALIEPCDGRGRAAEMACGPRILGIAQGCRPVATGREALCLPDRADGFRRREPVLAAQRADPAVIAAPRAAIPCPP